VIDEILTKKLAVEADGIDQESDNESLLNADSDHVDV
jgi:hypothetical protein